MSIPSSPRLWIAIAAAGAVAVVALGYVLFISGAKSDRASYTDQSAQAMSQAAVSRNKLRRLQQENRKLPEYRKQLATLKNAVPASPETAQFVRDMQLLSQRASVSITTINITPPSGSATPAAPSSGQSAADSSTSVTGGASTATVATSATELPISLTATGSPAHLEAFLDLLQNTESRALVIGQAVESAPSRGSSDGSGGPTLTVTMKAFFTAS